MRKEIILSESFGKVLEGYEFSITCGQAVITFTDGTFSTLGIDTGYADGCEEIEESSLELHDFGDDKLIKLNIITQDELDKIRKERNENLTYEHKQKERELYNKLKRKFEN